MVNEIDGSGTRIGFRFQFSSEQSRWFVWLLDLDLTLIAGPIRLVPGVDLLLQYKHDPRVPQGQLFVYSPTQAPPTLDTVDTDAVLFYRPPP